MEVIAYILIFTSLAFFVGLMSYPLFVYLNSLINTNRVNKSEAYLEPVSIIITCYNEETYIREKIVSLIDENEWIQGSELIIVSSGATDNTNVILEEFFNNEKLVLIIKKERYSKIDGVNMAVARAKNELLVFCDCRQKVKNGSVKALVHNFNDSSVGTVTGTLVDTMDGDKPSFFRSIFNYICLKESTVSSCLNVFGALYAQRRSVYREIPRDLLFDDLFVVVSTISQKKRLIQDEKAVIYDFNFDKYYQSERISRLARGLLIFQSSQFNLIKSMPSGSLIRFVLFKYAKLMMPFFLILFSIGLVMIMVLNHNIYMYVALFITLVLLLSLKKSRRFLTLFVRINYYFMIATLSYFFSLKRSNEWEKLQIKAKS